MQRKILKLSRPMASYRGQGPDVGFAWTRDQFTAYMHASMRSYRTSRIRNNPKALSAHGDPEDEFFWGSDR